MGGYEIIANVTDGGIAQAADVRLHDVIVSINGVDVRTLGHAGTIRAVACSAYLDFEIQRLPPDHPMIQEASLAIAGKAKAEARAAAAMAVVENTLRTPWFLN